jgi:NADH-quinone oxidoreductase subunit E
MLSPEERHEIETEAARSPDRKAAGIDALKIVQRHRRWVSDESLRDIADLLGMSTADLDGVATFYNLIARRPVGRHLIRICNSISCWILGYDRLLAALKGRLGIGLGETTADGRFTLVPVQCLGCCDRAPALLIDDDLHRDLDPERIGEVLERYP